MSVACALTADRLAPGCGCLVRGGTPLDRARPVAGARQARPRAGPRPRACGSARAAARSPRCPVLRSAVAVLRDVALLADLLPDDRPTPGVSAVGTLTAVPVPAPHDGRRAHGAAGRCCSPRSRSLPLGLLVVVIGWGGQQLELAPPSPSRSSPLGALAAGQPGDPLGRALRRGRRADRVVRRGAVARGDEVRHLRAGRRGRHRRGRRHPGGRAVVALPLLAGSRAGGGAGVRLPGRPDHHLPDRRCRPRDPTGSGCRTRARSPRSRRWSRGC